MESTSRCVQFALKRGFSCAVTIARSRTTLNASLLPSSRNLKISGLALGVSTMPKVPTRFTLSS